MIQSGYRLVLVSKQAWVGARVRHWLRLPHDICNDAIHTLSEGGLRIPSTLVVSKKLKESRLLNAEAIEGNAAQVYHKNVEHQNDY